MPKDVLSVLEKDFQEEGDGKLSQNDLCFMNIMETSVSQTESGKLQLPLPFKSRPQLPNNIEQAR